MPHRVLLRDHLEDGLGGSPTAPHKWDPYHPTAPRNRPTAPHTLGSLCLSAAPHLPPPHPTYFLPPSPQGSLALTLPVGRGVVQSIAFHPTLPCLLAATEGCVQLWREDGFEGDTTTT